MGDDEDVEEVFEVGDAREEGGDDDVVDQETRDGRVGEA